MRTNWIFTTLLIALILISAAVTAGYADQPFVPQVDNLVLSPPFTLYYDTILHDGKPKSAHFQPIPVRHSKVEFSDDGRNILLITRYDKPGSTNVFLYVGSKSYIWQRHTLFIEPGFYQMGGEIGEFLLPGYNLPLIFGPTKWSKMTDPTFIALSWQALFRSYLAAEPKSLSAVTIPVKGTERTFGNLIDATDAVGNAIPFGPGTLVSEGTGKNTKVLLAAHISSTGPTDSWQYLDDVRFDGIWLPSRFRFTDYGVRYKGAFHDFVTDCRLTESAPASLPSKAYDIRTYASKGDTVNDYTKGSLAIYTYNP